MSAARTFRAADEAHTKTQRDLRYSAICFLFELWSDAVSDDCSNFEQVGDNILNVSVSELWGEHYEKSRTEIINILYRLDVDLLLAAARRASTSTTE